MASAGTPAQMKQIVVHKYGNNFREVTQLVQVPVPTPGPRQALVRTSYASINAADVLFAAGCYTPDRQPPMVAGFEGLGVVVDLGEGSQLRIGQNVFMRGFGGVFSEYAIVDDGNIEAIPVDSPDPIFLALSGSGTTASLALEKKGDLKKRETVLITAAAGATGQFAVQLAKLAGCHVIGTCSTDEKAAFLKSIGCDRPVVYTKESLDDVVTKEYPRGIDVVYESVGHEMFDTCLKHLAPFGRMLDSFRGSTTSLPVSSLALKKSADIRGFFLPHYFSEVSEHIPKLQQLVASGQLKVEVDNGKNSDRGPFKGIESVYNGIDYMYSKQNTGKIVIKIGPSSVKSN
ncbi:hypothetical protein RRG08_024759 [Elysia crispata]|uniref:15-oxoprostaglandin 13-reductase n=1 Tax=Elysia crispata TaxID=231223 RepID=A0AAE1CSZ2_9GAST|nr:hypothetical protein RRG08_024759 [Elysia crispata]